MATELTDAQALVDDALSADEQAQYFDQQRRQHAVELLGHISNTERLDSEAALLTGEAKAQVESAAAESRAALDVVQRAVTTAKAKADAARAAIVAVDDVQP
tara:strand:+ start:762 stop:1067 length:306 start_codon:yes stop_codon:yes gene_type:complete